MTQDELAEVLCDRHGREDDAEEGVSWPYEGERGRAQWRRVAALAVQLLATPCASASAAPAAAVATAGIVGWLNPDNGDIVRDTHKRHMHIPESYSVPLVGAMGEEVYRDRGFVALHEDFGHDGEEMVPEEDEPHLRALVEGWSWVLVDRVFYRAASTRAEGA